MGAWLKTCLCAGIENVNNRLIIYHRNPISCIHSKTQPISFELLADAVKINQEYDEFMNTDSVISQEDCTIKLLKNHKGILTGPHKISEYICNMMVAFNDKGVRKIVIQEPNVNSNNKEFLYRAIFEGLYNFSSTPISHTRSVYINWQGLSAHEMREIGQTMMKEWKILAK